MTTILMPYWESLLTKTIKVNGNEKKYKVRKNNSSFSRIFELKIKIIPHELCLITPVKNN